MSIRPLITALLLILSTPFSHAALVAELRGGPAPTCLTESDVTDWALVESMAIRRFELQGQRFEIDLDVEFRSCRKLADGSFAFVPATAGQLESRTVVTDQARTVYEIKSTKTELLFLNEDLRLLEAKALLLDSSIQRTTLVAQLEREGLAEPFERFEVLLRAHRHYRIDGGAWTPAGMKVSKSYGLFIREP